jgi:hypothetical protein
MTTQAATVEKLGRKDMLDTSITCNYIACLAIEEGIGFGRAAQLVTTSSSSNASKKPATEASGVTVRKAASPQLL